MSSSTWGPRLGLASAVLMAVGCIAVLAAHAVNDHRLQATLPGETAPDFVLARIGGAGESNAGAFRLSDQQGAVVVLYFCSTRCPVSNDYEQRVIELQNRLAGNSGVRFVAVHTGSPPASSLDVESRSRSAGQQFSSVIDADGAVASAYAVRSTPTFLVIDAAGAIRYRGSFDDNRNAAQATTGYVETAVRQLLAGTPVQRPLTEAFGCPLR